MRKPTPRTYAFGTMYLGMAATLAGNAATANWSNPMGVVIAVLPALGLFLTFEMVMRAVATPARRKPIHHVMRLVPAVAIMLGAAYVSVGHLVEVAHANGQTGAAAWITALLPDAMMILAAVVIKDSPAPRTSTRTAPARKRTPKAKANPITADAPAPVPAARRRGTAAAAA